MANRFAALGGDSDSDDDKPVIVAGAGKKAAGPAAVKPAGAKPNNKAAVKPARDGAQSEGSNAPAYEGDNRATTRGGGRARGTGGRGRGAPKGEHRSRDGRPSNRDQQTRNGAGRGNWGSAAETVSDAVDGTAAPAADANGNDAAADEDAEPEIETMTLADFLAQKKSSAPVISNIRKAGDGVDNKEWKDAKLAERKDGEEYLAAKKAEKVLANERKAQRSNTKQTVEVTINYTESQNSRNSNDDYAPRGGRGGFRGGRGGGGGRGGSSSDRGSSAPRGGRGGARGGGAPRGGRGGANSGPKVNHTSVEEFPSLS